MPKSIVINNPISARKDSLAMLLNSFSDALVWADTEGKIIGCNGVALRMLGYSQKGMLEKSLTDIIPAGLPKEFSLFDAALGRHPCGVRTMNEKCPVKTRKGRIFMAEVMVTHFQDSDRNHRTAVLIMNSTPNKWKLNDVYEAKAHNSPVGTYIVQGRRFRFANPRFQQDIGFTEGELLDIDPISRVHPEDKEMVRKSAIDILKGKRSSGYEFRGITKDGEIRWFYETVTSITYNGHLATLGSSKDITEQK
ncbi:MAG: PAS domain-containing protein [Dehalococcoidia bacterium]|nr:PAS domain-containing protein [Dehalococcoidia bacterium]